MASQIPASQLQIVNMALNKIGEPLLSTLSGTDDVTSHINAVWPRLVAAELQAFSWRFSVKRKLIQAEVLYGTSGVAAVSGTYHWLPVSGTYAAGDRVTIDNTSYWDGTWVIQSGSASGVWVSGTFYAETFSGVEKFYGAPPWGFNYRFAVPAEALKFLQIGEIFPGVSQDDYRNADVSDYRIEGSYILRNDNADLEVRYVAPLNYEDLTVVSGYDPLFVDALACRLAAELSTRVTDDEQTKQSISADYYRAVTKAVRAGAIESAPEPLADGEWVLSRQ